MILSVVDDPRHIVFTLKPIYSDKVIDQFFVYQPINTYKIKKMREKIFKQYTGIVKIDWKENAFTKKEIRNMFLK